MNGAQICFLFFLVFIVVPLVWWSHPSVVRKILDNLEEKDKQLAKSQNRGH